MSSPTLMYAIQRDQWDIIDTVLVGMNANDRRYGSHQYNVLALAVARGVSVIAMKVFADGSNNPGDVILSVGQPGGVPPSDFIRCPLSIPGVAVAITGIGRIDRDNAEADQIVSNLAAALSDVASTSELRRIEDEAAAAYGTETNYFNERREAMVQPTQVEAQQDADRIIGRWNTALAGPAPVRS